MAAQCVQRRLNTESGNSKRTCNTIHSRGKVMLLVESEILFTGGGEEAHP